MDALSITQALRAAGLTCAVEFHEAISSTNDRAREALAAGVADLVVVADSQSHGRGRPGRQWQDLPGAALLFSLAAMPDIPRLQWPLFGLAGALATAEAVRALSAVSARIKWPNDVVAALPGGAWAKIAGVLLESHPEGIVLGIGVNVTAAPTLPPNGAPLAAACLEDLGCAPRREDLLADLLWRLDLQLDALRRGRAAEVLDAVRRLDITQGLHVTLALGEETVAGVVEGLDGSGALILRTFAGVRTIRAGDVHLSPHLGTTEAGRS